jgi:hypothetical protein
VTVRVGPELAVPKHSEKSVKAILHAREKCVLIRAPVTRARHSGAP